MTHGKVRRPATVSQRNHSSLSRRITQVLTTSHALLIVGGRHRPVAILLNILWKSQRSSLQENGTRSNGEQQSRTIAQFLRGSGPADGGSKPQIPSARANGQPLKPFN